MIKIRDFIFNEGGGTMAEYALVVVLIAVVCVAIITTIGMSVSGFFSGVTFR
jgi:Flp pilus assembly pilin Flp